MFGDFGKSYICQTLDIEWDETRRSFKRIEYEHFNVICSQKTTVWFYIQLLKYWKSKLIRKACTTNPLPLNFKKPNSKLRTCKFILTLELGSTTWIANACTARLEWSGQAIALLNGRGNKCNSYRSGSGLWKLALRLLSDSKTSLRGSSQHSSIHKSVATDLDLKFTAQMID